MKKNVPEQQDKSAFPVISLLITIAAMAITCAMVIYKYTSDKTHRRRWQDYDDCGLA